MIMVSRRLPEEQMRIVPVTLNAPVTVMVSRVGTVVPIDVPILMMAAVKTEAEIERSRSFG